MRLTNDEKLALIQEVKRFLLQRTGVRSDYKLYLFGSRTHDDMKGGDIDLLLLIPDSHLAHLVNIEKHHLIASLKTSVGDQRVDLVLQTSEKLAPEYAEIIRTSAVLLDHYPE